MEVQNVKMILMPPAKHLCQECGRDHDPKMPHDATSLYYQTKFQIEHGRPATWDDAMAHCDEATKELWKGAMALIDENMRGDAANE